MREGLDRLLHDCIVRVVAGADRHGTGFFVAPGRVLTCAHVVEDIPAQTPLTIVWGEHSYTISTMNRAGPTSREPNGPDLALLAVELADHPCVLLADDLRYSDSLYTYGYSYVPYQSSDAQGDSVTLQYEGPTDRGRLLKLKGGQVESGLSGGPLLNWRTGSVCGVVKSTRDDRDDLGGRAVTVAAILEAFPELAALQQEYHARDSRWRTAQRELTTPNTRPSVFQVPYGASACFGRDDELEGLDRLLTAGSTVALAGAGGMGKTFLAATYAHRFRTRYPGGIVWLRMDTSIDVGAQVAACGGPDGLDLPGWQAADFDARVAMVRAAWQKDAPLLLVFDNLNDPALLETWRPKTGGSHVLVTSLRTEWPAFSGVQILPVGELARQASLALLCSARAVVAQESMDQLMADPDANVICELVGDLPLAVALAAAYLATYPGLRPGDYRAKLQASVLNHRSMTMIPVGALPTAHTPHVAATIGISYDQLDMTETTDSLALTFLRRGAHLASAPIPYRLLVRAAGSDPDALEADGIEVDALRRLRALGLVTEENGDMLRLHRLVSAFVRSRNKGADVDIAAVEMALIAEAGRVRDSGETRSEVEYLPHLSYVVASATPRRDDRVAMVLDTHGNLLQDQGDYGAARPLYEEALAIRERTPGPTHIGTAASLNNLGALLRDQGDYAGARPLLERALAIVEQALGLDHPSVGTSINNFAALLKDQCDYEGARLLYERALGVWQRVEDRMREATTFVALGRLAAQLDHTGGGARLVALGVAIEQQNGHPDFDSDYHILTTMALALGYSEHQVGIVLQQATKSYQIDKGWALVRAAFKE